MATANPTSVRPTLYFNCVPFHAHIGDMIVDSARQTFVLTQHGSRRVWINIATGEKIAIDVMRAKFAPLADPLKDLPPEEKARIRAERDEFFSNGKETNRRRPCAVCGKTDNTLDMSVNTTMMTFSHVGCT